jgi:DHA2 family multidrug resistance protein
MTDSSAEAFFAAARPHRGIITICMIAAALLQVLDATIANVALPHMQGSLSAATDQISWVLTSYLISAAIVMPSIAWIAGRFGRRRVVLVCMAGFTMGSMLCGTAQSLEQMVIYRLIQGVFGAGLVPMSQSVILDIYTLAERGKAMSMWSAGIMVGPIIGPTLGAWLTDTYDWRWVFYVNVPIGVVGFAGIWLYLPAGTLERARRFDWLGFVSLAVGIAGFQLVLDRGETKDWFGSYEIVIEATMCVVGFYLFAVQTLLAKHPFISRQILNNRNFVTSILLCFAVGAVLNSTSALLPPYFQGLAGYPVLLSGLAMMPRGIGTVLVTPVVSKLMSTMDPRHLMAFGLMSLSYATWQMAHWTPDVSIAAQIPMQMLQGASMTIVFTPMQLVAFSNVPGALRTEASGLMSLFRNFGGSTGVATLETLLVRNTQASHQDLARFATPFNRALQSGAAHQAWDPAVAGGAMRLDAMVNHQAQIIAYSDDFLFVSIAIIPAALAILLMRRPAAARVADAETHSAIE